MPRYVFGPVPSRRLGVSLGINNIPYKACSYSCVYCQLGRTLKMTVKRRPFSDPEAIAREVKEVISKGVNVDYATFVPDGEPTLDSSIGRSAGLIGRLGVRIAVLTNASLLWREDVRADLQSFSLVSLKIDAVEERLWRKINRPHRSLRLKRVLEGIEEFAEKYDGILLTETMLVKGLNTCEECLGEIAFFIAGRVKPRKAYITVPIRPPAEKWVMPPSEEELLRAHEIFSRTLGEDSVELLAYPEPPRFRVIGDPTDYLLRTLSVHPMRIEHALEALKGLTENPKRLVENLVDSGLVSIVAYMGSKFLVRNIEGPGKRRERHR